MTRPYRLSYWLWGARVVSICGWVFIFLLVLTTLLSQTTDDGSTFPVHRRLLNSALIIVILGSQNWALWRLTRMGVHLTNDGVAVVRFVGTSRYPWSEIAGFDAIPSRQERHGWARILTSRAHQVMRIHFVDGRERVTTSNLAAGGRTGPAEIARRLEAARPAGAGLN